jgi:transcriptional regulator with XRE-family HTH domain
MPTTLAPTPTRHVLRVAAGLTFAEVAAECGVSAMTVHRWESERALRRTARQPKGRGRYNALLNEWARDLGIMADAVPRAEIGIKR